MTPHHVDFDALQQSVIERSYATLPCLLSYADLSRAAEAFFAFLELSPQQKGQYVARVAQDDPESNIGYVRKCREGTCDEKEYVHYNRYAPEVFEGFVQQDGTRAQEFFKRAGEVYEVAERMAIEILRQAEERFPGVYERFVPHDQYPHFYLRFLKYDVQGKGEFLADGHYDQGALTLALAESAPGLRIGRDEASLEEVTHHDGEALVMPGLQLSHIFSADFHPAWHDVVQKSEDTYNTETARWAIVFFVDPVDKAESTWEDRHTILDD